MMRTAFKKRSEGCSQDLGRQVRDRIESLSYLPTSAAVALRFVELGRNLDADAADYAKVISADSSLSGKILALTNSSWAGVRNKVVDIKTAVSLLGLGTVRTLGISYCMAGLHNALRLSTEESRMFWEASLCRAVAAKQYAGLFDVEQCDPAYLAGLFQDIAMPVMFATARTQYPPILRNSTSNVRDQLREERKLFQMDHAEIGRIFAQKMELPDLFVDSVAFHHSRDKLKEFVNDKVMVEAIHVSSLFPHVLNEWKIEDVTTLREYFRDHAPTTDIEDFFGSVQKEFNAVFAFFHEGNVPETQLVHLLEMATREAADSTTEMIDTINSLRRQAASTGMEMHRLRSQQSRLEDKSVRDPLTGVLNREGFRTEALDRLANASRYGIGFAMIYLDIDKFKRINDDFGHEFGDAALTTVVSRINVASPQPHLIGRIGGDEFVILLDECSEESARHFVDLVLSKVAETPVEKRGDQGHICLSAGLIFVPPSRRKHEFSALIDASDKLMYRAKRAGGNRVETCTLQA